MRVLFSRLLKRAGHCSRTTSFGVLEALVVLAAMALVDRAHWLPFSITGLEPHPFWVPVALAAAGYGRAAGYVVACCAAGLNAALAWSGFAEHPDFYDFMLANSTDAVLWLAAAAVLGRLHERQALRRSEAEQARDRRAEEAQLLAERCQALAREAAELERRIAATGASAAGSVLEVFRDVMRLAGERCVDGYRQALNLLIGANGIDVYAATESGWEPLPGADDRAAAPVPAELCDAVASAEGVLSCARPSEARLLDGYAAMAACVRGKAGQPLGVVLIREVDPACMTAAGEAAVSLASFILAHRCLEVEPPLIEERSTYQIKSHLRLVMGEGARGEAQP